MAKRHCKKGKVKSGPRKGMCKKHRAHRKSGRKHSRKGCKHGYLKNPTKRRRCKKK